MKDMKDSPFSDSNLCNVDIALDFDGVIHIHDEWMPCNETNGEPVFGVLNMIIYYVQHGYSVAVFSVRSNWQEGRDTMRNFIAEHTNDAFADVLEYPDHKPKAKWYFDDRAIRVDSPILPTVQALEGLRMPWHRTHKLILEKRRKRDERINL